MYSISKTKKMIYISMMTVVMAICSLITIPGAVPFTLQTMAVFMGIWIIGGKYMTYSLILYMIMGSIGVPVFSGFKGGIGVILGPTGGYIVGFVLITGGVWIYEKITDDISDKIQIIIMIAGMLLCYFCGTVWYMYVMKITINGEGISSILMICVVPYILPDTIKFILAKIIGKRVKRHIDFVR